MHLPGTPSRRGQKPPFLNKKRSNWPGMGLPGEASRGASRGPPGGLPGGPGGPGGPGRPGPARAGNFPPGSLARAPAREGSREGSRRVVLEGGFQTLPDGDISTDPIGVTPSVVTVMSREAVSCLAREATASRRAVARRDAMLGAMDATQSRVARCASW